MKIYIAESKREDYLSLKKKVQNWGKKKGHVLDFYWQDFVSYQLPQVLNECDMAFLETQIGDFSGLEYAKYIRSYYPDLPIVFCSYHEGLAYQSYEVNALGYLIKPLAEEKVKDVMEKMDRMKLYQKKFHFKYGRNWMSIEMNRIIYIETANHQIIIHTPLEDYEVNMTLNDVLTNLDDRFFKCHRSFIVNKRYVRAMNDLTLLLTNNITIPVSRRRARMIEKIFMEQL